MISIYFLVFLFNLRYKIHLALHFSAGTLLKIYPFDSPYFSLTHINMFLVACLLNMLRNIFIICLYIHTYLLHETDPFLRS